MIIAVPTGKSVVRMLMAGALVVFGSYGASAATVLSTTRTADSGGVSYHTSTKFLAGSSEMSAVIWVKNFTAVWSLYLLQQPGQFGFLADNGSQEIRIAVTQDGDSAKVSANTSVLSRNILKDGAWHCVCTTFKYDSDDSTKSFLRIYCDGKLAGELTGSTITGPLKEPTDGLTVGGQWTGSYSNWRAAGRFAELSL